MKKQINKKFLSEGYGSMLRDLANEKEDYVNEHPDYFMYETDDLEEFDTLEDAIAYAKKCAECNTITRVQIGYEEEGPEFDDEVVWTREEGKLVEKLLKEGTSNFYSLKGGLPLLVFYTIDEIYYQMDNDDENPRNHEDDYESDEALEDAYEEFEQKFFDSLDVSVLDEDDVDRLNADLSDLNGELQSISYDLYDEYDYLNSDDERYDDKKVSHMLDQSSFLEDIKFGVKPGYYSAAQIYCEGDMYFEDLDKEYQDLILKRLKELQKKYHLSRLGVSYRFSNGETGYHKIEESKKKSLKEQKLNEGTSNFGRVDPLPLLVFYTYDEVLYSRDNDDENPRNHPDDYASDEELEDAFEEWEQEYFDKVDVCILDEYDVDELEKDLGDLNGELKSLSYELYDKASDLEYDEGGYEAHKEEVDHLYDQSTTLEDVASFDIKSGYYSAAYINCDGNRYIEDLDDEYRNLVFNKINEIKKKYGLTELEVAWGPASNGETGYRKVNESKKKSLKESKEPLYRVVKNGQGKYFILKRVNDGNTFKNDHSKETFNTPEEAKAAMENPSKLSFHFNEGASYRGLAYYEYPKGSGCHVRETPEVFVAISESGKTLGQDKMKTGAESIIDEYLKKKNESIEGTPKASDYKKLAKKHQKTNKKGARGTFERVANTDPKKNMEIFNHMMGSDVSTSGEASVSEAKKPLSNKEIDAKVKRNQKYLNHINKEKEQKSKGEKPIKEDKDLVKSAYESGNMFDVYDAFEKIDRVKAKKVSNRAIKNSTVAKEIGINSLDDLWEAFEIDGGNEDVDEVLLEVIHALDVAFKTSLYKNSNESLDEDGEKPIKESRDEERVANYQKDLDELGATEEECNKFIKIADDYEEKAQRHFITYDQMDEVAKATGLKEMSDKELARAWKVCYYTLNREAFKEDDSEDLKRYAKYSDAASAFAEVINREARERKEKGNYDPTKDESLKKGSRKNIKEEK